MALVMSTMPDVWRKVLAEHVDDGTGRCRACRNANGETAAWPCQTFRVAQEAKWVAEGNLPGTGPHGSHGPSATPRLSPLDESRHSRPTGATGYDGADLPSAGRHDVGTGGHGFGTSWDLPGSRGAGPATSGWDLPGPGGADLGGGRSWDLDGPMPADPYADDAATAFGGLGTAPALASLPPLPPTAAPAPAPAPSYSTSMPSWRDDPLGPGPLDAVPSGDAWGRDPWSEEPRHGSWRSESSAPYGSRVDAPYGSTFGVDDRPRGSRH